MIGRIERDEEMDRTYIPLPGGWEVQTKGKGSTFRIYDPKGGRLAIDPRPYLHETLTKMANDVHAAARATEEECFELRRKNEALEQLRPGWARGYTDDSVAAQCATAAMTQLWKMLGVDNQTHAVQALKQLLGFKGYVHERLDAMGVPVDPESPHKAAGCRVGGRLDYVEAALARPPVAPVSGGAPERNASVLRQIVEAAQRRQLSIHECDQLNNLLTAALSSPPGVQEEFPKHCGPVGADKCLYCGRRRTDNDVARCVDTKAAYNAARADNGDPDTIVPAPAPGKKRPPHA